jgi:hypothetical protein
MSSRHYSNFLGNSTHDCQDIGRYERKNGEEKDIKKGRDTESKDKWNKETRKEKR